jgi:Ca2+/H+ antiporter
MTSMRGIWLHLFLTTFMLISFLGSASVYADFRIHCHAEHHHLVADSVSFDNSAPAADDHHHHDHKSVQCCSSISLIKAEVPTLSIARDLVAVFGESINQLKPPPLLEGPFQPPRV